MLGVLAAVAVGPLAVLEAAGYRDAAALREVLSAVLGEGAEGGHIDVDRRLLLAVLRTAWDGEAHAGDLGVALGLRSSVSRVRRPTRLMLFMVRSPYSRPGAGLGALTQPETGAHTAAKRQPRKGPPEGSERLARSRRRRKLGADKQHPRARAPRGQVDFLWIDQPCSE